MHLVVIGINYRTAPVELRERLSIPESQLPDALDSLGSCDNVHECLILSTCNRTEVYAYTSSRADDATIRRWLADLCKIPLPELERHLYSQSGHKAAEHLFRVAAGIDSMVLGEAQILGQVKEAYAFASRQGFTGSVLNTLFQQAITTGKRSRTETEIGRGAFSVGSVAVQLAKSIFNDLKGRTVFIVGAGKMGELTVTHLVSGGATELLVTNRTHEKAVDLASRFNGKPVRFEQLGLALGKADIVITSTGAREPVISRKMVSEAVYSRRGRPVFFIDIAVPRDIETGVGDMDNVFVYNIDDLQAAVNADAAERKVEVARVGAIIEEEVAGFTMWFRALNAVPVITALREKFEEIRIQELEKLHGKLQHLSEEDVEVINATTRSIVNKICHTPMIRIKEYATDPDPALTLDHICELFGICPIRQDKESNSDSD